MAEFGWSAGCILDAIKVCNQVCKALQETGGAKDQYMEAISFLTQSDCVFRELERHIQDFPESRFSDVIVQQLKLIEKPWNGLEAQLAKYKKSLADNSSRSKMKQVPRKMQWVLRELDQAVKSAKAEILGPLQMINCLLQGNCQDDKWKVPKIIDDFQDADLPNVLQIGFQDLSLRVQDHETVQNETFELVKQVQQSIKKHEAAVMETLQKSHDLLRDLTDTSHVIRIQQNELIVLLSQKITTAESDQSLPFEDLYSHLRTQQSSINKVHEALQELTRSSSRLSHDDASTPRLANEPSGVIDAISVLKSVVTSTSMFWLGYFMRPKASNAESNVQPPLPLGHTSQGSLLQPQSESPSPDHLLQEDCTQEFHAVALLAQSQCRPSRHVDEEISWNHSGFGLQYSAPRMDWVSNSVSRGTDEMFWYCSRCMSGPYSLLQWQCDLCGYLQ